MLTKTCSVIDIYTVQKQYQVVTAGGSGWLGKISKLPNRGAVVFVMNSVVHGSLSVA